MSVAWVLGLMDGAKTKRRHNLIRGTKDSCLQPVWLDLDEKN